MAPAGSLVFTHGFSNLLERSVFPFVRQSADSAKKRVLSMEFVLF